MSYKKQIIEVSISGGVKIEVKRLLPKQYTESGVIPDVLFDPFTDTDNRKKVVNDKKVLLEIQKISFLKGVVPQADFVPVDKPSADCYPHEVSFEDVFEEDKLIIMTAAMTGGAGGVKPDSFPASQEQNTP